MKTTITTKAITSNSNLDNAAIRGNIRDVVEYLPDGLKRATLLDIYRAAVRDMANAVIKQETPEGATLAAAALPFIIDQPTIEQIHLAVEGLYPLFDEYTDMTADVSMDTGFDTIIPEKAAEFIEAVEVMAQSARNIINL